MGMDLTTSTNLHRCIKGLCFFLCAQAICAAPNCNQHQYSKHKKCCSKCPAGTYALEPCTATSDTRCLPCGPNEYEPDWNMDEKCISQKFCDKVRGFEPEGPDNRTAAVQCRCLPGYQCHIINCEYCVRMAICLPGQEPISDGWGQGLCVKCRYGFFSDVSSATKPCKPWTDCGAQGQTVVQAGTDKEDTVCGPDSAGASVPWLVVVILSVVFAASFFTGFLFFRKDTWKHLSVNAITCVQTLKSRALRQEALPTTYHSARGQQNCLLEVTCLIEHEKNLPDTLMASTNDRLAHGSQEPIAVREGKAKAVIGPGGEPSEGSLCTLASRSWPCNCGLSKKEPMELGENEDISQAVVSCVCGTDRPPFLYQELVARSGCTDMRGPCNLCADVCSQPTEQAIDGVSTAEAGSCSGHVRSAALEPMFVSDNNVSLLLPGQSSTALGQQDEGAGRERRTSAGQWLMAIFPWGPSLGRARHMWHSDGQSEEAPGDRAWGEPVTCGSPPANQRRPLGTKPGKGPSHVAL